MRVIQAFATALVITIALVVAGNVTGVSAQMDPDRKVPNGGIKVNGWQGKIDDASAKNGYTVNDSLFAQNAGTIQIASGPAAYYWNPDMKASGDYTVSAKFTEDKFMSSNSHPHSYGIFIGGNALGTDQNSLVYCVAYGDGRALVRGFGPAVFTLLRPSANPAVNKASAKGEPVSQEIAWTVKGGRAECSINGKVVAGYDKAEIVAPGKLTSTDGIFGIRVTHNVDVTVSGLAAAK